MTEWQRYYISSVYYATCAYLKIDWYEAVTEKNTTLIKFSFFMTKTSSHFSFMFQVLSYCLTKYEVLQFTDFFFSLLCFWVTIVNLAGMDETLCPFLHTLGVVIIAPAVQYSRTALASFTFPMAVATAIPVSTKCVVYFSRVFW